ncbi:hypothetical protein PITCH_A1920060 [uncultured Desulfobacterium sp.]|uniref:Uncharacterized protein n=1 Tax=uncultured Desulfobacterium sp. TaxID=201089 RepID=A0A445MWJ7_9BACT|nr:hypothetical protein PITCH_A1920060 [uncultured Desulfobacterium sp.]
MTEKLVDLHKYKKAKDDYQKLLNRNPYTLLTFEDFVRVRKFLEEIHRARLMKEKTDHEKEKT